AQTNCYRILCVDEAQHSTCPPRSREGGVFQSVRRTRDARAHFWPAPEAPRNPALGPLARFPARYALVPAFSGTTFSRGLRKREISTSRPTRSSTANFLRAHRWRAGAGYQPGEANFGAIQAWNAAPVYQRAIALIGRQIDGGEGTSARP